LLAEVPQSRLFDEMLKLLQTGHALASVEQLKKLGLSQGIYPLLDVAVDRADDPFVKLALQDTDRRVGEGKPVAPSFLLAAVLWSDVREGWARKQAQRMPPFSALQEAVDEVFDARIGDVSGRGKLGADMREIWLMQTRFEKRTGNAPFSLAEQARFRAGFDYLRLRAQVGEVPTELAEWWETFSTADDATRQDMVDAVRAEQAAKPRQRAPRVHQVIKPASTPLTDAREPTDDPRFRTDMGTGADDLPPRGEAGDPDAPVRKRRRRRRKPGAGEGAPASDAGSN
jgi:poly(A) polymerase